MCGLNEDFRLVYPGEQACGRVLAVSADAD